MFKKSTADDIANLMQRNLIANAIDEINVPTNVEKVVDHLNSAADLFEEAGMQTEAETITQMIERLAQMNTKKVNDSTRQVNNLKHTGTPFAFDDADDAVDAVDDDGTDGTDESADNKKETLELDDEALADLEKMMNFEDE